MFKRLKSWAIYVTCLSTAAFIVVKVAEIYVAGTNYFAPSVTVPLVFASDRTDKNRPTVELAQADGAAAKAAVPSAAKPSVSQVFVAVIAMWNEAVALKGLEAEFEALLDEGERIVRNSRAIGREDLVRKVEVHLPRLREQLATTRAELKRRQQLLAPILVRHPLLRDFFEGWRESRV